MWCRACRRGWRARFFRAEDRAQRNAAGERLGERGDVGLNAVVLIGAPLAGAAHAGLNLIDDEQRAGGVAQSAGFGKELLRERANAAFALDGFDEDGADFVENLARRSATSLKRTNSTPGTTGPNGSRYLALYVVDTEPKVRPWKLCSRARNLVPMFAPSLRSRPAWARASFSAPSQASVPVLAKKHAVEAGALGEAQSEFRLALVIVEVRRVDERAALFGDGFFNNRMVIAERVDADAAEQVEVLRTVLVDDVNTLAADKEDGVAVVGGKQKLCFRGANLIEFGHIRNLLVAQRTPDRDSSPSSGAKAQGS
jgi:hypothetical protein